MTHKNNEAFEQFLDWVQAYYRSPQKPPFSRAYRFAVSLAQSEGLDLDVPHESTARRWIIRREIEALLPCGAKKGGAA